MTPTAKIILVVEDESAQRGVLHEKLSKEGFEIIEAKNGNEGLVVAKRERPDLILLDIMMPEVDGLEMARRLREDEWGKKVPIIILSNFDDMTRLQEAIDQNVFHYFVKSNTPINVIIAKVKECLELSTKI